MPWLNSTGKKIQSFHWVPLAGLTELSFMTGTGLDWAGEANYIDFHELSGQQQTSRSIKFEMNTSYADDEHRTIVYVLWFADSRAELEEAVLNGTPTQIVSSSWPVNLPLLLPFHVSTRYMAISFDGSKSNHVPEFTSISIHVC